MAAHASRQRARCGHGYAAAAILQRAGGSEFIELVERRSIIYVEAEHGRVTDRLREALRRRAMSLKVRAEAAHRLEKHSIIRTAQGVALGLSNYCTAMVLFEGRAD